MEVWFLETRLVWYCTLGKKDGLMMLGVIWPGENVLR